MAEESHAEQLRNAQLKDVPIAMLEEQFQDVRARNSRTCDAEYGIRADDEAWVFHFFPPGFALDDTLDWTDWTGFRDKLERAIMSNFDVSSIQANYVEELSSFYLIVKPPPPLSEVDTMVLIERFFSALEA